jgi:collagen type I alpha
VLAGDALMQIGRLCNGATIAQETVETVTYYHIELETHDVLLAEGLPAETYLDTDGRANFEAAGAVVRLHPDFGAGGADVAAIWDMFGCAPMVVTGPRLDEERRRLAARAVALNPERGHEPRASAG